MSILDSKKTVSFLMKVEDYVLNRPLLHEILSALPRKLRGSYFNRKPAERIFTEYFQRNQWGDEESLSGSGSNRMETRAIQRDLPTLVRKYGIHSILDIPCGDFNWMKEIDLREIHYIGADIVGSLVDANNSKYGAGNRMFTRRSILKDSLPEADLVFVRDCLVHFSFADVFRALKNLCASGSRYLLTTTFTCVHRNRNIPTGAWRPLNLQREPFSFPEPIAILYEDHPVVEYKDKSLALWRISDIAKCLP
jgi:SAM-dependent methyltransferase